MKRISGFVRISGLFFALALLITPYAAWAIEGPPPPQSGGTPSSEPQSSGTRSPTPQAVDRSVTPDVVTTLDGSTLQGTVTGMQNDTLTLKNKFASAVEIDQDKVVTILTTGELDIVMYDKRRLRGALTTDADGAVVITPADGSASVTVAWKDIAEIWSMPPFWDGEIAFGFSENSGNSESLGGTVGVNAARNGEQNRFGARGQLSLLNAFGEDAVQKSSAWINYAHYLRARTFLHVTQDLVHDIGQDLRVQSGSHVGVGYILVERPNSMLSVAFGAGLFLNRFEVDTANDSTNFSGRGEVALKIPFGRGITLTDHLVFYVHNSSHVNNTLTLKFKLAADWKLHFGSNLQVNSDPSILADRWDHQTMMGLTYAF